MLALLASQVAANNAIVTSVSEQGHWDVSLNITHIDLMPGVAPFQPSLYKKDLEHSISVRIMAPRRAERLYLPS